MINKLFFNDFYYIPDVFALLFLFNEKKSTSLRILVVDIFKHLKGPNTKK